MNQSVLDILSGNSAIWREIRKMEDAQKIWKQNLLPTIALADQYRHVIESNSIAAVATKQFQEIERQRAESIKRMIVPIADIRNSMLLDPKIKTMIEGFASQHHVGGLLAKLQGETSHFASAIRDMQDTIRASTAHAQLAIEKAQKQWVVSPELIRSLGATKSIQDQISQLKLPIIDWASAATIAKLLGPEGIEAQLAALGIGPDGTIEDVALKSEEQGIGLSRKALEIMTLLSFILALLVPIYQEQSSGISQKQTGEKLDAQKLILETQVKKIEALSKLLEKALEQEIRRTDVRYVVLDRVATVRAKPAHGSALIGKLLPCEAVRPIGEKGKWIQVEYYHWLQQDYQTGWALKKYFTRMPPTYSNDKNQEAKLNKAQQFLRGSKSL